MTPLDFRTGDDWGAVLRRLAMESRMSASLTDDAGNILLTRGDRYPLCAAIREKKETLTFICGQINTAMLQVARNTCKPDIDFCDVGLFRMVVPIVNAGKLVGQVTACGLASKDEEFDAFLVAKELSLIETEAVDLARSTPFGSMEELRGIAERLSAVLNP